MVNLLEKLELWLAVQLNKLAVKSPTLFIIIQALLVAISGLLFSGKIVIPTPDALLPILGVFELNNFNFIVASLVAGVVALLKVPTNERLKKAGKL